MQLDAANCSHYKSAIPVSLADGAHSNPHFAPNMLAIRTQSSALDPNASGIQLIPHLLIKGPDLLRESP